MASTIVHVAPFAKARKPSVKLSIDLEPELGIRNSSAQVTHQYQPQGSIDRQIICSVNFPRKMIASFSYEVLVTGFTDQNSHVVVSSIDKLVPNEVLLF